MRNLISLRVRDLLGIFAFTFFAQSVVGETVAQVPPTEAYVRQLGQLINDYRQQHGLQPLNFVQDLANLADEHSTRMAAQRKLSHDGFRDRAVRTRSKVCVENVGWNYPSPATQLEGWKLSPTHDRNLLEPKVSGMGLAVTTRYVAFFACT